MTGPADRIAYAIASGAGAGLAPVAPGTMGALEGVVVFLAAVAVSKDVLHFEPTGRVAFLVVLNIAIFLVGVWSATRTCEITGIKDPGRIVIDEVSGQLITLVPLASTVSIRGAIAGFFLFRLFDILKPYPIRKLERLNAGWGVMADDALAGVYAAVLLWAAHRWNLV